ncbi:MAG: hypothetical protein JWP75_3689 [Frondihabitans sp.]|nr:hypothetical protein [Frondihabitans sp.]
MVADFALAILIYTHVIPYFGPIPFIVTIVWILTTQVIYELRKRPRKLARVLKRD